MIDLKADFQERVAEVEAFLDLIRAIERSVQEGLPLIRSRSATESAAAVSPLQQKLLYAGVYLHLYNLVEAMVSRCIAALEEAASTSSSIRAGDLSKQMRSEWVRAIGRTHETLSTDSRLSAALDLCEHVVSMLPLRMKIDPGGGGNWDDEEIFDFFGKRLGVRLALTTAGAVKRPYRNNRGALKTIRDLRNKLAHGEMSFAECGEGHTARQLDELKDVTVAYLAEVIDSFVAYVTAQEFLRPDKRAC